MRVIIAGDRRFGAIRQRPKPTDEQVATMKEAAEYFMGVVLDQVADFRRRYGQIDLVISGGANGIDSLGQLLAKRITGRKAQVVKANWMSEGKKAGALRNAKMAEAADGAIIIAAPDSRGSWDMYRKAVERGIPVVIKTFNWDDLDFMFPGLLDCYPER
jgi:hypothetical protein